MTRTLPIFIVLGLLASSAAVRSQDGAFRSALHDYRIATVVEGLIQPWSIAFLPGGDMLITERPGRLRIIRQGKLLPQPVEGVPTVLPGSRWPPRGRAAPELRDEPAGSTSPTRSLSRR